MGGQNERWWLLLMPQDPCLWKSLVTPEHFHPGRSAICSGSSQKPGDRREQSARSSGAVTVASPPLVSHTVCTYRAFLGARLVSQAWGCRSSHEVYSSTALLPFRAPRAQAGNADRAWVAPGQLDIRTRPHTPLGLCARPGAVLANALELLNLHSGFRDRSIRVINTPFCGFWVILPIWVIIFIMLCGPF